MRLRRLILGRYGHLSDVQLTFPEAPGLHIVLGANEAGKSTALAAIGDCLFGFPHRSPYAFLHATRDLRIGVALQSRDGRQATFFRRKGRKEDLFDDEDRPLPESAIAAFLAGATRERFNRIFGLNGAELRQGGDSILKGQGEVGEAIIGAHTGLHGFHALVDRLDADAGKLFGDKRGRRAFHEAADRFTEARHAVTERRIEPADYKQARDDLSALETTRADYALRAAALHAERSRLDRIRRTTPARLALSRFLADREALGPVPDLPPNAAEQQRDAIARRDQALRDLAREQARAEALEIELKHLPENPPILALGEVVDALAADRQRVAGAARDREAQGLLAGQRAVAMVEEGRRLGLSLDADGLAAKIPNALDREKVNQALRRHARLSGQQTAAIENLVTAETKLTDAKAVLEALPPAEPAADLRHTIEAAKEEGRLDADLAEAASAVQAAKADLARSLAALPFWDRDAAALAAAPVPLAADIQRLVDVLKARQEDVRTIETSLAEHDRLLRDWAAQAQADTAAGDLPTTEAIQAARVRRDRAWALIRRVHLDGGAPVSPAETEALDLGPGLPARFEGLIQAADRLADRRAVEQERVVAVEQRRSAQVRQQALRDGDELARIAAAERLDGAEAGWRALWQPSGIEAAEPAAMREWMQKRAAILADYKRVLDAERRLETMHRRHKDAFAALAALLPAEAKAAGNALATLLRSAERSCRDREKQVEHRTKAQEAVEAAIAEQAKAARAMARIEADIMVWHASWAASAEALSLPPDASPDLGATALGLWEAIDKAARDRRDAMDRIAEMTASVDQFSAATGAVVRQIAPDLAEIDPLDSIITLSRRLAAARQDAQHRNNLIAEAGRIRAAVEESGKQRDAAEDALCRLRTQAGAADDDALNETLDRWSRHRALAGQIAGREAELRGLDDGKTVPELAAEADGVDFDALPAGIAAIETELRGINTEVLANQEQMVGLKQRLASMEHGKDAAAAAQDMETALADIDSIAGRYVTLRMAHVLLRAGIERFRRQQQGPLLNRAGQIFARLTEGRYDRLSVDEEEDGKIVVVACRPDGTECQADRLSEGTLDQLYLALRLAAIEGDARTTDPLPFIGDDLLVNFDDRRARAAIRVLADFAQVTQVVLFTHHGHIADMAEPGLASVHRLAADVAVGQ